MRPACARDCDRARRTATVRPRPPTAVECAPLCPPCGLRGAPGDLSGSAPPCERRGTLETRAGSTLRSVDAPLGCSPPPARPGALESTQLGSADTTDGDTRPVGRASGEWAASDRAPGAAAGRTPLPAPAVRDAAAPAARAARVALGTAAAAAYAGTASRGNVDHSAPATAGDASCSCAKALSRQGAPPAAAD